ncbi:MAG: glycosyltransferase family 117 protein, partial [Bacteroidota bacterium]
MEQKKINRLNAIAIFFVSLVTYVLTLSPTVVFWDVGEFCAAAYLMQVPHPPGAPLFLLVARFFSMFPFAEDIAVRMHFISALSSALSVMFLYLISVRFISMWRGLPETTADRIVIYG